MNLIANAAHELRIALQDAGLVRWDGVTGGADEWADDVEALIADHISAAIADAKEAETGR